MKKKTEFLEQTEEESADQERKKQKEKDKYREVRWDRLDNTAHLFPVIAGEQMTNVYRISVTLTELVQPELLQEALNLVLPKMDGFDLRLRMGVFWYYFEENGKPAPRVREESNFPCRLIQQNKNRNYMFRVTYYKYRINLEVFHVLTDGMGGINFLKELTYQYLRLAHPELKELVGDSLNSGTSLNREDSFLKNYKKSATKGHQTKKAYSVKRGDASEGRVRCHARLYGDSTVKRSLPQLWMQHQRISGGGICLERVYGMHERNAVGTPNPGCGSGEFKTLF